MFSEHGRGELCSPAGDRRSPLRIHKNFGRDVFFSADLCYNVANRKPPSEREPMVRSCIFRGMGFARCLCNTKAKLAIKRNDKFSFSK